MRIAYLAAGGAGMYCGSCLRDNRLAATLLEQGRSIRLIPLYTPIRTDEQDVSESRVFFGGIGAYLNVKAPLLRRLPRVVDRLLDHPAVLRHVGRFAGSTRGEDLGALTLSVLRGEDGVQRREVEQLIAELRRDPVDLVNLPNLMFVGVGKALRAALGVPIVCTLSGEDIFLDALPEPFRTQALDLIAGHSADVDRYVAVTRYFGRHATAKFGLPAERVRVVPLGIRAEASSAPAPAPDGPPWTIGYLGRICPAKGLHNLVHALMILRAEGFPCRVRAAGFLGGADRPYLEALRHEIRDAGLDSAFEYVGELTREEKSQFLRSLHVFTLPTDYHEAKGLPVLEALACGVPVVQPRHGSFPELVEATGGGVLYDAEDDRGLADALRSLLTDAERRRTLSATGQAAVLRDFNDGLMAQRTWELYAELGPSGSGARTA